MVKLAGPVAPPVAARARAVLPAALAVAAVTFAYRFLSFGEFSNDHFVHLSGAQQLLLGALPVRDFVDSGLPLMYGMSALAQQALGPGLLSELLFVSAAFAVAAALCSNVSARVSGSASMGVLAAAVPTLVYPASYSYPKLLAYAAAIVAAAMYAVKPTVGRLAILAAAVVAAFLFRHDHGVLLGVAAVAAVAASSRGGREIAGALARFAVIGLLLLSPYLLWIQFHDGLTQYFSDGTAFSRRESEKAVWAVPEFAIDTTQPMLSRLGRGPVVNVRWASDLSDAAQVQRETDHGLTRLDPIGPRSWQYELSDWSSLAIGRLVQDPAVADTQGIDRKELRLTGAEPGAVASLLVRVWGPGRGMRLRPNAVAALFYAVWLLPFAAAVLLLAGWRTATAPARAVVLMAIVVQVLMNLTMLRDPLDTRIRDVIVPAAILLAYVAARLWSVAPAAAPRVVFRTAAAVAIAVMIVAAGTVGAADERIAAMHLATGISGTMERVHEIRQELAPPNERTGRLNPGYAATVAYFRSCMPAGARLFTMTFAPELFFYTGHGFAGGHVSFTPGFYVTERHEALTLERLSREDVPFVVLDSESSREMPQNFPRVFAYITSRYREVDRFTIARGKDLVVLADTTRPRTGHLTIKGQQLPCFAAAVAH